MMELQQSSVISMRVTERGGRDQEEQEGGAGGETGGGEAGEVGDGHGVEGGAAPAEPGQGGNREEAAQYSTQRMDGPCITWSGECLVGFRSLLSQSGSQSQCDKINIEEFL